MRVESAIKGVPFLLPLPRTKGSWKPLRFAVKYCTTVGHLSDGWRTMNIWGRFCISAAIGSLFCLLMSVFVKTTEFYAGHRWYFCLALLAAGASVALLGWVLQRKSGGTQVQPSAGDSATNGPEVPDEPFILRSVTFWGAMIVLFALLTVFIKPRPGTRIIQVQAASVQPSGSSRTRGSEPSAQASATKVDLAPTNKAPSIKLQGISYRKQNASVLINGKTLFVGDRVGSAKLIAIEPHSATLEIDGEQQVLTLGE